MPASQAARGGLLVAAALLFVTGAISLAFVSDSGRVARVTSPRASTSVPVSTPVTNPPATVLPDTGASTTVATVGTTVATAPATTAGAAPTVPAPPSVAGRNLAHTGFDSTVAFMASVAVISGLVVIWLEERTRLLRRVAPASPAGPRRKVPARTTGRPRPAPYQPKHAAPGRRVL